MFNIIIGYVLIVKEIVMKVLIHVDMSHIQHEDAVNGFVMLDVVNTYSGVKGYGKMSVDVDLI